MDWIRAGIFGIAAMTVVASIVPIWRTTRWWVRIWDFPRFQIALVALILLVTTPLVHTPEGLLDWMLLGSLVGVVLWQSTWVGPYLPGTPRQVKTCKKNDGSNRIALLTTNVLQTNRDAHRLIKIIRKADPDLVLAVEVDEWWAQRLLEGLGAKYAYKICYPLSNGYGLALFSRLELVGPKVQFILDEAIPSVQTGVRLRSGSVVQVYGVHPRPPSLFQDTTERDIELLRVARNIADSETPAIVLGDLNDVAWSPSTMTFMKTGDLLDPRRGRGFFNTYPARWPGLRYPLDYIFSTRHFKVCSMRVLPAFGSDHLPLTAELSLYA
jgi:endonuclease/exonuclease/phosphatase (EEP) superfamily protein YafD